MNKIQITSHTLIIFCITVAILYLGQNLIIPFIFGTILWLLMRKIRSLFEKLGSFGRIIPKWIKTLISTGILFCTVYAIGLIIESNIQVLLTHYDSYNTNLGKLTTQWESLHYLNLDSLINSLNSNDLIKRFITLALFSLQSIIANVIVVLIYMLFLILEESSFINKIQAMYVDEHLISQRVNIIKQIEDAITNYLGIKSLMALISSVIGYFIFVLLGLHAPFFWALLIFILSFIPFIGVLVSAFLPSLFAIAQFGNFTESLIILFSTGAIQFISGNILEPRIMGNSMNVSPLVVIIALGFWGTIWGLPGMFLSVPITVILVIVLSKFESTRKIAILLSEKGEINHL